MANFEAVLFGLFLMVAQAIAARPGHKPLVYSAKYTGSVLAKTSRTQDLKEVPIHKANQVLANMKKWSGGQFKASPGRNGKVVVSNKKPAKSKGAASGQVQKMKSIVHKNYDPNRKSKTDKVKVGVSKAKAKVKGAVHSIKNVFKGKKKPRSLRRRSLKRSNMKRQY
ncbi:unnamed protein product [Clonostachys chloroleuca]|uniref:Uncharacterized protein n=1 Tax=Clonostachys chloroleuca TaxID=1926264 RepID=A0AA35PZ98_9HYPO|nr:unnamed protein product [Clonostachys chloroleuca]